MQRVLDTRMVAYISLGGNLGNEARVFAEALAAVAAMPGVRVETVSARYRTEPQDDADQPWFSNQVARLRCGKSVTPERLLSSLLALEQTLGRVRDAARRHGPRVIDIDLLLFGDAVRDSAFLTLPHPRMTLRAFVLVPLLELDPGLSLPGGKKLAALLEELPYSSDGTTIYQKSIYNGHPKSK